jgi:hypothetical protein
VHEINGYLFHTRADLQIRQCIQEEKIYDILKAGHDEPCGGHFADRRTGHKILQMVYYWPSIFRDAKKYVQTCERCQQMGKPSQADEIPLKTQLVIEPFERWALEFVAPFNPKSNQKAYILIVTDDQMGRGGRFTKCNRGSHQIHFQIVCTVWTT